VRSGITVLRSVVGAAQIGGSSSTARQGIKQKGKTIPGQLAGRVQKKDLCCRRLSATVLVRLSGKRSKKNSSRNGGVGGRAIKRKKTQRTAAGAGKKNGGLNQLQRRHKAERVSRK